MSARVARLLALAAATGLVAAACGSSSGGGSSNGASTSAASSGGSAAVVASAGAHQISVTLTPAGCAPARITVPAGPVTFDVRNEGADAISELEIVKDGKVVGEVENVSSGLRGELSLRLEPDTYETRSPGGATAGTGTLVVTGTARRPSRPATSPTTTASTWWAGRTSSSA